MATCRPGSARSESSAAAVELGLAFVAIAEDGEAVRLDQSRAVAHGLVGRYARRDLRVRKPQRPAHRRAHQRRIDHVRAKGRDLEFHARAVVAERHAHAVARAVFNVFRVKIVSGIEPEGQLAQRAFVGGERLVVAVEDRQPVRGHVFKDLALGAQHARVIL